MFGNILCVYFQFILGDDGSICLGFKVFGR